MKFYL
ncbi:hypothetical protein CP8484711_0950A, partial [Chlamydia psittaci 84-8471/1]